MSVCKTYKIEITENLLLNELLKLQLLSQISKRYTWYHYLMKTLLQNGRSYKS